MTPAPDFATSALLATTWSIFAAGSSVVCAGLSPWLLRATADWAASGRSALITLLAMAPALIPTAVIVLCTAPGIVGFLTGSGDHCPAHLEHAHLCLLHGSIAWSASIAVGASAFVLAGGAILLAGFAQLRRGSARTRVLRATDTRRYARDVWVLPTSDVIALTTGFARPRIWLSAGLIDGLTPDQREVVLAHERAHADRRDPARFALASCLSRLHWPPLRRALLAALSLASEQACDDVAAGRVGDRIRVAETLVRVERLLLEGSGTQNPTGLQAGLTGSTVPLRVKRLLAGPPRQPADRRAFERFRMTRGRALVAAIALAAMLAVPLHHAAEHALELVAGWL